MFEHTESETLREIAEQEWAQEKFERALETEMELWHDHMRDMGEI